MDWGKFFEDTRRAAGAESFAQLAPMLDISDGAISHYRTGKRVPDVWIVADCLKLQGHPAPERAAIEIMRAGARTPRERTYWRKLAASALTALIALGSIPSHAAYLTASSSLPPDDTGRGGGIMRSLRRLIRAGIGTFLDLYAVLSHALQRHRPMESDDCLAA